jgi:parallel beta-helix repeat protein
VANDRPKRWIGAEDAWLFGYWYWDWSDQSAQIASIDPITHVIRSVHASGYGVRSRQRFFAFNLLEELDAPGEWFLDRKLGVLYFYPVGEDLQGTATLSLCTAPLFELRDASHVTLRNLRLGTTCGDGIHITQGTGIVVENCELGNLGGQALSIDQGSQHTVRNCFVHDTGAGGIRASGGDRQTLAAAGHRIENNEITRFSRLRKTYSEAIALDGVGNVAVGNLIHDAPHAAIHFLGNDHTIEFNEIHHVLLESDDAGAVYSGRRLTFWGNKIRHNYFHDIYGLAPGQTRFKRILAHAIYLDDALSGIEVTGNVFHRCNDAICVKGSDNRLNGNVIIDCRKSIVDFSKTPAGTHTRPLRFDQPDGLPTDMDLTKLTDILSVPYTSQRWRERYPGLATSLEQTYGAWRVSMVGNVLLRTPEIETTSWLKELGRIEGNILLHDKVDFDEAADLATWLETISQRVPGFQPIPFSKIGLGSGTK